MEFLFVKFINKRAASNGSSVKWGIALLLIENGDGGEPSNQFLTIVVGYGMADDPYISLGNGPLIRCLLFVDKSMIYYINIQTAIYQYAKDFTCRRRSIFVIIVEK